MNVHLLVNLHLIFQILFETPIGKKLKKKKNSVSWRGGLY